MGATLQLSGLMEKLHVASEWLIYFFLTNVIWIILNAPVVFFTINYFILDELDALIANSIILAILIPFVTFPPTAALFALMRKWAMHERETPVFRSYWKFYKENFVKSMLGGIIITMIWAVIIVDFYILINHFSPLFLMLFIVILLFLVTFTLYFFASVVHFNIKLFDLIKNALLMTIAKPVLSVGVAIISGIIMFISINKLTFLIPTLTGSIIAYIAFFAFYRVYKNVEQTHKMKEN